MKAPKRAVVDRTLLQSVQRASAVLDQISRTRTPVTVSHLATTLQLDRTIVYRIVRTLEAEELLEQTSDGYRMGRRALLLGNAYLDGMTVRRVALPYQVDLLDRVLKSKPWRTSIMVQVRDEISLVDTVYNSAAPLDMQLSMGRRFPIATTAAGRAMMAYLDPEEVVRLVGAETARQLEAEFTKIRDAGGVAMIKDFVPGASAIAATIFDGNGAPVAALLLSGLELDEHLVANV